MSSRKGGAYERHICVMLSLWWSHGDRDDLLWRTGGSGGRATTRGKRGKKTSGQYGDVSATDPLAEPLIRTLTIEIKRGYSKHTVADMLDKPRGGADQEWGTWLRQVLVSHFQSGSLAWLLIQRRDRREALVFFPDYLYEALIKVGSLSRVVYPQARFDFKLDGMYHQIYCMKLTSFLNHVEPDDVKRLVSND